MKYDVIVLGGGPGGYVAAIRASQLGKKVALIEKDRLGGVCLNRGCIPTKALLRSAHAVHQIDEMKELGLNVALNSLDAKTAVSRANGITEKISKGVEFLMKKNKIDVIKGEGKIIDAHTIEVDQAKFNFSNLIISTGAHYRTFPGLEHDGKNIIGAWEALKLDQLPKSIGVVGAGAIGVEFAYFWHAFGVEVHIFEMQKHLLPVEDDDSSIELERAYKKLGIKLHLGVNDLSLLPSEQFVTLKAVEQGKGQEYQFDKILLAVGMTGNIDGFGLQALGVKTERGFISVNEMGQTSLPHIYAIGDVTGKMQLAHVASHQGVIAAEHLSDKKPHALNLLHVPACTYAYPQVASVGYRERQLKELGISYNSAKLPFKNNGKAMASQEDSGFIKVLLGEHDELLGAHIVGEAATELIHEYTLFMSMEGVADDLISTVHPHPTLGEWLHEAVLAAKGLGLNS